ncbi:hypothetical protein QFZ37_003899 [Chryseobacterium ginsenosidimutans]|uniref:hypothetical protein n=1 Tax=Chryseobacterium ginsenosidimutans TaxID=687846 RepID=UPI0027844D10|nr:hypothetical protein [Chryseobacterium ginsenosidimutans]MDQ0595530.1 hypothetical protein [Chryseobacterium ginsenosidimutans]
MQKFNKHNVLKDESLKSIASLYHVSVDALKQFHNNHCEVKDMILISLNGQKELFIPRTAVADKNKVVKFGHGNRLVFQPENSFCNYGVIITIENGNHKNELKYNTSVRWLKTENKLHFFEVDRISNLYLNEEEVNEIADLLAYKTSKVLYPLQISVDENGRFYDVDNLSVFKERWANVKDEIYQEFEGETVDQYCEKIEEIINEPNVINLYLKNDYFIRTLFFGIYKKFDPNYQTEITETFPVVDNAVEPQYKISLEADPLKDDYNLINIQGEGKLNDERNVYDFINEAPFSTAIEDHPVMNQEGDFRLMYYLNGETALAESLYLECDIQLEQRKKISVAISSLGEN